jgi:hypothetical protein
MSSSGRRPRRTSHKASAVTAASTIALATSSTPSSWRSVAVVSVSGTATTSVPPLGSVVVSARQAVLPSRTVNATVLASPSAPSSGGGKVEGSGGTARSW